MKLFRIPLLWRFSMVLVSSMLLVACSDDEKTDELATGFNSLELTQDDQKALLFMLEEEKLARDTYEFLDELYAINQFSNIKLSEQSHMNAVINLLEKYGVVYNVLPYGLFENKDIQRLYDQFVDKGQLDALNALQVGANIEDLDIVDLTEFIETTSNSSMISVFESLQCGSRNHLRSFVSAIENFKGSYEPQFLSSDEYIEIIEASNERCGR